MAKKKPARGTGQTSQVLSRLQENLRRIQRDAESMLSRTSTQASQIITRDQKRALDRLFSQAQRLRTDLEKRATRATKDLESRAERFLGTLEKETAKRLVPLLRRLDLPSRQEVTNLARRINHLERRLRATQAVTVPTGDARSDEPVN